MRHQVIAFTRDTDNKEQRKNEIYNGLNAAYEKWGLQIGIIGGCATPCLEGWILAIQGMPKTEELSKPKVLGFAKERNVESTEQMVQCIETEGFERLAQDAECLNNWKCNAERVLCS